MILSIEKAFADGKRKNKRPGRTYRNMSDVERICVTSGDLLPRVHSNNFISSKMQKSNEVVSRNALSYAPLDNSYLVDIRFMVYKHARAVEGGDGQSKTLGPLVHLATRICQVQ